MAVPECRVEVVRGAAAHTRQIVAGYLMLAKAGEIELDMKFLPKTPTAWTFIVNVIVNDEIRLGYDLQDGHLEPNSEVNRNYLDSLDLLFARGYAPGTYGAWEDRIKPLGLNYSVTIRHPTAMRANFSGMKEAARTISKRLLGWAPSETIRTFEQPPRPLNGGPVLFLSRLWEPEDHEKGRLDELNGRRAECVRALQRAFGDRFVGGLAASPYALEHYPDCVVDQSLTRKANYLAAVRRADVCVTTTGLAGSTGWKFTEYVAMSKPIVTEPLRYPVPGNLLPERNYLAFESPDACVEQVQAYLDDPQRAMDSAVANHEYYESWVRPDSIVRYTLRTALEATR